METSGGGERIGGGKEGRKEGEFGVPIEKGAQADFSLIISGYRYQRSGMNS